MNTKNFNVDNPSLMNKLSTTDCS